VRYGYRLILDFERPERDLVESFRDIATAQVSDSLGRTQTPNCQLLPIGGPEVRLCGPAFTVRTRTADNLLIHKALQVARPGDVIVVDGQGDSTTALVGELMALQAKVAGLEGFVINGLVRDPDGIADLEFPVFARGVTPRGPQKDGPGELNVAVSLCGVTVNPGDIVLGDANGIVVVPREAAQETYKQAMAIVEAEEEKVRELRSRTADLSWVDKRLREQGFDS